MQSCREWSNHRKEQYYCRIRGSPHTISSLRANPIDVRATTTPTSSLFLPDKRAFTDFHTPVPPSVLLLFNFYSPLLHCVNGVHTLGSVPLPLLCFFLDHDLYTIQSNSTAVAFLQIIFTGAALMFGGGGGVY